MTNKDQLTLLYIKSLLNYLTYFIKDSDLSAVDDYHTLCRKYCSWGRKNEPHKKNKN